MLCWLPSWQTDGRRGTIWWVLSWLSVIHLHSSSGAGAEWWCVRLKCCFEYVSDGYNSYAVCRNSTAGHENAHTQAWNGINRRLGRCVCVCVSKAKSSQALIGWMMHHSAVSFSSFHFISLCPLSLFLSFFWCVRVRIKGKEKNRRQTQFERAIDASHWELRAKWCICICLLNFSA